MKISGMEAGRTAYETIEEPGMEGRALFDYTEMNSLYKINPRIKMMPQAYSYDQMRKTIDKDLSAQIPPLKAPLCVLKLAIKAAVCG